MDVPMTPSEELLVNDFNGDPGDEEDLLDSSRDSSKFVDSRHRVEEMLEKRSLEKDLREFDFDI